jgi:tetratricopeptide (TPR) repeat protein
MRKLGKMAAVLVPLMAASALWAQGGPAPGDLFAQGRFAEAAPAYEAAVARSPADAAALAGLARMRLFEGREADAIELARKALAVSPGDPVATSVVATAQARQAALRAYEIKGADAPVTIPFLITDPLPVVQVVVGGKPANLLLDTGGPGISIKQSLAEGLGLSVANAGEGVFAGGLRAPVRRTTVPELQVGPLRMSNVPAGVMPGEGLRLPGVQIDGVIGTGFLMHFLSTIDYCRGALVLAPRASSAAFEARAKASGANVVPMWLAGDHFLFARARLNRAPEMLFSVDTGLAGGGLTAIKEALDAAGVTIDESKAGTGIGGGGAVRVIPFAADATLGTLTRTGVPGIYSPDGSPYGIFPFKVAGAVSHAFFRQSRVTFDFDAMKLITESC